MSDRLDSILPKEVDIDELYRESLNVVLAEYDIPPMIQHLQWGDIVHEMSPTDFNCGQADWLDVQLRDDRLKEYKGAYYNHSDFVSAVQEAIEEIDQQIAGEQSDDEEVDVSALEDEKEDLEKLL